MYRISFFNTKGGTGKSTLSIMCAASIADAGAKVCIVDLDTQRTCLTFSARCKNSTFDVVKSEKELQHFEDIGKTYDVLIYDHSPERDPQNLPHVGSNAIIIPFQASGPDTWSTVTAFEALEKRGQPVLKVLNRFDKKRKLSKEFLDEVKVDHIVHERSIYSRTLTEFTTVYTSTGVLPLFAHGLSDARKEIDGLVEKIIDQIKRA